MSGKSCFKCGEFQPLSNYYRHAGMVDGHLNKCKTCTKADVSKRRSENIDVVRKYDRERARRPERIRNAIRVTREWRQMDSRRMAAHNAVARAVRNGTLIPQPCERCGREDTHAHHDDYTHPLAVMWLCPVDHKIRHAELQSEGRDPCEV